MRVTFFAAATLIASLAFAAHVSAQTWSASRARPPLWQISSVDASGEPSWPYESEDIAGDGLATFETDEAATDLRTLYADANGDELWIRAYVADASAPPDELVAFFFLDIDDRDNTGGDAQGALLWKDWDSDPSAGGYERAVGVRGDGTLIGAFRWRTSGWMELTTMPDDVRVEVGVDRDPIGIGGVQHGYIQVALHRNTFGVDATCNGNIFVRLWHDDTPKRSFGDDDDKQAACRPPTDALGDPVVLRPGECSTDAECPADGDCVDGVCLFGYECSGNADCRTGETCSSGVCVRAPGDRCTTDADCDGLVCSANQCVACANTGARACNGDAMCAPNGTCFAAGEVAGPIPPGKVRGGAFECAARSPGGGTTWPAWLLLGAVAVHAVRRSRRRA